MELVYSELVKSLEENKPCVLATAVRTQGSTPQKVGTKLLVREDGSTAGTIGGGCVEHDIQIEAMNLLLDRESKPFVREYEMNEVMAAEQGLVCGGTMWFLLEPIWQPEPYLSYARQIIEAHNGKPYFAIASLVKATPRMSANVGAKLIIHNNGSASGSLSIEALDSLITSTALSMMREGINNFMLKEKETEVFIEVFGTPLTLIVFGAGHIGKSLSKMTKLLGFQSIIIDDREDYANIESFPEADKVLAMDFVESMKQLPLNPGTAVVVATRGHRHDYYVLKELIKYPVGYIGMVGSRRKQILIYEELFAGGVPMEPLLKVKSPVGLNIGARTPEEIALSIMAEILMWRNGGDGKPLNMDEQLIIKTFHKAARKSIKAVTQV